MWLHFIIRSRKVYSDKAKMNCKLYEGKQLMKLTLHKCSCWLHKISKSSCSKWRASVALHNSRRRMSDWCTLLKFCDVALILSAAAAILTMRSSALLTGDSHINNFICPQKRKFSELKFRECKGYVMCPPGISVWAGTPCRGESYVSFYNTEIKSWYRNKNSL